MNSTRFLSLSLVAAAVLAGCAGTPPRNAALDEATSAYRSAQADPRSGEYAAIEMKQAADALALADAASARGDDKAKIDQLAYLARQRSALAQATTERKVAEQAMVQASADSDKLRLAARTREADAAQQTAAVAERDKQVAQRQSSMAQQQSQSAQQNAVLAQQQAAVAQQQAGEAESRSRALESRLSELNARKTDRGMVITLGDVLFDTDRAELKSGAVRNVERLAGFLKQYPQRKAVIEGFTDSVGNADHNQMLSSRRADAVRAAIVGMGVGPERLSTQGFGESNPVAGNDTASGRQQNRRVEIILSDESGAVAPR
jgi:outer membrane protein OmpA-like peptidoglycan-associated protein